MAQTPTDQSAGAAARPVRLTQTEINMLGKYNAERSRGLVHRQDWDDEMRQLQQRFDLEYPEAAIYAADMGERHFVII